MDDLLVFANHKVYVDVLDGYGEDDDLEIPFQNFEEILKRQVIDKLKVFFCKIDGAKNKEQKEIAISELSAELYKIRVSLK